MLDPEAAAASRLKRGRKKAEGRRRKVEGERRVRSASTFSSGRARGLVGPEGTDRERARGRARRRAQRTTARARAPPGRVVLGGGGGLHPPRRGASVELGARGPWALG